MMKTVVSGAGPAGLACADVLTQAGRRVVVFERAPGVGGLTRTVVRNGFRFDLGGHQWFTKNQELNQPDRSFEDWVARRFGRILFELFFRSYSEKVRGIPCDRISADRAAQRIRNLSIPAMIRSSLFGNADGGPKPLVDQFWYPALGYGRITERLAGRITRRNTIHLRAEVIALRHDGGRVRAVRIRTAARPSSAWSPNLVRSFTVRSWTGCRKPHGPVEHGASLDRAGVAARWSAAVARPGYADRRPHTQGLRHRQGGGCPFGGKWIGHSILDLAPTFLVAAGVKAQGDLDGRPLPYFSAQGLVAVP